MRLRLHALAYDLGNFLRAPATLKEELIKTGAKAASHGRCVAFRMAEAATARGRFADILRMIAESRPPPLASTA